MNVQKQVPLIERKSLHTELVERLQDLIIDGTLVPGTKVPEKELCEQFGVSRTPMREALKVLAADGLISLEPNRGAWVSKLTIEELEEVFPVMAVLEALSGELACAYITDAEIADVRRIHNEMVTHFEARRLTDYFRTNQEIHESILRAARNTTLATQHRALAARVRRARYMANMSDARWQMAVNEHEEIIDALERRDGERLGGTLRKHIENKFETVLDWLRKQDDAA